MMDAYVVKMDRASNAVAMGLVFAVGCASGASGPGGGSPDGGQAVGSGGATGTGGGTGTGGVRGTGGVTATGGVAGMTATGTGGRGGAAGTGVAGRAGAGQSWGEFNALSYNVAGLPEALSGSEPSVNTPYISPLLNDYDLVMVQEDWKEPSPNLLALLGYHVYHDVLAKEARHPYQSVPKPIPVLTDLTRITALVSDGLNFFSDLAFEEPVVRVRWTGCFGDANTGAGDCLAQKGFSMAAMEFAPGVKIDIYTLHAEAGSTEMDQALQVADYQQLGAYILAHSAGHAIILGGDTNLHIAAAADLTIWNDFLRSTGLIDVCKTLACAAADNLEIDKFTYRDNGSITITPLTHAFPRSKFVRPTDGEPLSDHPPLAVRFRWTARN